MRLFELLSRARAVTRRRHNRMTREQLGVSTLELAALWLAREPIAASALAKGLHLDLGAATRLVDQLVRKNLATRTTDPNDRRRRLIQRTEAGTVIASNGSGLVQQANEGLREGFTEEELAIVARFLRHLIAAEESP